MSEEPVILNWVILKIVQRCNLNCSYCYVYNRGDDSWKYRAPIISDVVVAALARRIVEHCEKYSLPIFTIELHGGEPLLIGHSRLQVLIDSFRQLCDPIEIRFFLQTNGLLLDQEWLELFDRNNIGFGISCDGPPEIADKKRVFVNGKGSTQQLLDKIAELRRSGPLFDNLNPGMLCVVDPEANGGEVVRWFVANGFRGFDFLLPDGTYVNMPQAWTGPNPYLQFLLQAFEEWYGMEGDAPQVRLFELMMLGLMGVKPRLDSLGGDPRQLCVVESDGSMTLSDLMRICGGRFSKDLLNVFENSLDALSEYYELDVLSEPCAQCQRCPYFEGCGGGLLSHRFDGKTFANPSMYCVALYGLAERIANALRHDLPINFWTSGVSHPEGNENPV